jgi:hypothetical protein
MDELAKGCNIENTKKVIALHLTLGDACNELKKLAIEKGDESTYKLAMAWVRMAIDEVSQIIIVRNRRPPISDKCGFPDEESSIASTHVYYLL